MNKLTQKRKVLVFIKGQYPNWVMSYDIEKFALSNFIMGGTSLRRCRDLVDEGYLEKRIKDKFIEYQYLPREQKQLTSDELLQVSLGKGFEKP